MFQIRRANQRGKADFGWLHSQHSFSFGQYYDPQHMGFSSLRVINEDRVLPSKGFGTHPHSNMEILSFVISGTLEHKDSMGNGGYIHPNEIQLMSAGKGITHSEYNASNSDLVHFLQIWLHPNVTDIEPSYQQQSFEDADRKNTFLELVSPKNAPQSKGLLQIHQDASIFTSLLEEGKRLSRDLVRSRKYWIQMIDGFLDVITSKGMMQLEAGDGLAVADEIVLELEARKQSTFLLFELP